MAEKHVISMTSGVSARDGHPFVDYEWGGEKTQFTAAEARAHAFALLTVAEAAVMDAAVIEFFMQRLDLSREKAAQVIYDLRQFRADMREQAS